MLRAESGLPFERCKLLTQMADLLNDGFVALLKIEVMVINRVLDRANRLGEIRELRSNAVGVLFDVLVVPQSCIVVLLGQLRVCGPQHNQTTAS